MAFRKNFGEFIAENAKNKSNSMFLSEQSDHEGWLVVGFDKDTKKAEVLSIPLLRKEAVRFLQSFESQMGKLADHMKKYTKLKLAHASEVFESIELEGDEYSITEYGQPRKVGTYRSKDGQSFTKYRDDENYTSIMVNGYYITIDLNGEGDNPSQKEIQDNIDKMKKIPAQPRYQGRNRY